MLIFLPCPWFKFLFFDKFRKIQKHYANNFSYTVQINVNKKIVCTSL